MHTSKSKPLPAFGEASMVRDAADKRVGDGADFDAGTLKLSVSGAPTASVEQHSIMNPPPAVRHFAVDQFPSPQRLDYAAQPAYAPFMKASMPRRIAATARFVSSLLPLAAKRLANYELIPNEVRMRRDVIGRLGLLASGLRNLSVRTRGRGEPASPAARALAGDGVVVVTSSSAAIAPVEAASAGAFAKLEQARRARTGGKREFVESRFHANRRDETRLFATMEAFLAGAGILDAASEYIGRPAKLVDVNPQINDRSDSFWKDVFPDMDLPRLPKTAYFHRDASGGDLKAIVYLSDVQPSNGPFGFVLGSHRLPISRWGDFICEANDHNGLAHTDPISRRRFAALPARFRQKGAFGNDLPDEYPASREIVGATWSITGPKGSIVLFDTKGIHRGGMVEQGERRVITCVIG